MLLTSLVSLLFLFRKPSSFYTHNPFYWLMCLVCKHLDDYNFVLLFNLSSGNFSILFLMSKNYVDYYMPLDLNISFQSIHQFLSCKRKFIWDLIEMALTIQIKLDRTDILTIWRVIINEYGIILKFGESF